MRFRFTKAGLRELKTEKSREWFYDDQVHSLACMVTKAGAKSFYVSKLYRGKKHQIRIGSVEDIPILKARQIAVEILGQLLAGKMPASRREAVRQEEITLAEAAEEYFKYADAHRRPVTVAKYRSQWKSYIAPWAGKRRLADFRRLDVRNFHLQLGADIGQVTANRVIALIRAIYNRTIREHELELLNPAISITAFRERSRTRRLQHGEIRAFFEALAAEANQDIRDFILLLLYTGARKSNLLAMRWKDLDLNVGTWVVPAEQAKSGVEIPIALAGTVCEILRARQSQPQNEFVFPGRYGRGHLKEPKIGWDRIRNRAGLQDLRMHDLRRSLASYQLDTGAPLEVIQKTLGHENRTTTEVYARMALDPVRQSLEKAVQAIQRHASRLD